MVRTIKIFSVIFFCLLPVLIGGCWDIQFERNCSGYLKRAADANTVGMAIKELEIAISYMENKNLTSGFTSVIYNTPDEDVGFWYKNIKSAATELKKMNLTATQLEKSNMLIKLRETLLDQSDHGKTVITLPPGIIKYPYNFLIAVVCFFYYVFWIIFVIILAYTEKK